MTTQTKILTFDVNCNPSTTDLLDLCVSSANDLAASSLAYAMASNDALSINGRVGAFYLVDDFDSDSLTTKTNASYNAAGDYYTSLGFTTTPSASGEWSGNTSEISFVGDNVDFIASNTGIYTTDTFTGDISFQLTLAESVTNSCGFAIYDVSEQASFLDNDGSTYGACRTMTNAWVVSLHSTSTYYKALKGNTIEANDIFNQALNDVIKMERDGGVVKVYQNNVLRYTFADSSDNEVRIALFEYESGNVRFDDVSWIFPSTPQNITLAPSAMTLDTADPDGITAYIVIDPQETITVGTDIVMTMSIDGGTTDATGTWTKVGSLGSGGEELWRVDADVTAQTGLSLIWEITTHNNKEIRLNGIVGLITQ